MSFRFENTEGATPKPSNGHLARRSQCSFDQQTFWMDFEDTLSLKNTHLWGWPSSYILSCSVIEHQDVITYHNHSPYKWLSSDNYKTKWRKFLWAVPAKFLSSKKDGMRKRIGMKCPDDHQGSWPYELHKTLTYIFMLQFLTTRLGT